MKIGEHLPVTRPSRMYVHTLIVSYLYSLSAALRHRLGSSVLHLIGYPSVAYM